MAAAQVVQHHQGGRLQAEGPGQTVGADAQVVALQGHAQGGGHAPLDGVGVVGAAVEPQDAPLKVGLQFLGGGDGQFRLADAADAAHAGDGGCIARFQAPAHPAQVFFAAHQPIGAGVGDAGVQAGRGRRRADGGLRRQPLPKDVQDFGQHGGMFGGLLPGALVKEFLERTLLLGFFHQASQKEIGNWRHLPQPILAGWAFQVQAVCPGPGQILSHRPSVPPQDRRQHRHRLVFQEAWIKQPCRRVAVFVTGFGVSLVQCPGKGALDRIAAQGRPQSVTEAALLQRIANDRFNDCT